MILFIHLFRSLLKREKKIYSFIKFQYQYSIFWLKSIFREFIANFNIKPTPIDKERPKFYSFSLEIAKTFTSKFENWCKIENERRTKINEIKKKQSPKNNR